MRLHFKFQYLLISFVSLFSFICISYGQDAGSQINREPAVVEGPVVQSVTIEDSQVQEIRNEDIEYRNSLLNSIGRIPDEVDKEVEASVVRQQVESESSPESNYK